MATTTDNSNNFPHEFTLCPKCDKKGVYRIRPNVILDKDKDFIQLSGEIYRCKYCKWQTLFAHEVNLGSGILT